MYARIIAQKKFTNFDGIDILISKNLENPIDTEFFYSQVLPEANIKVFIKRSDNYPSSLPEEELFLNISHLKGLIKLGSQLMAENDNYMGLNGDEILFEYSRLMNYSAYDNNGDPISLSELFSYYDTHYAEVYFSVSNIQDWLGVIKHDPQELLTENEELKSQIAKLEQRIVEFEKQGLSEDGIYFPYSTPELEALLTAINVLDLKNKGKGELHPDFEVQDVQREVFKALEKSVSNKKDLSNRKIEGITKAIYNCLKPKIIQ